MKPSNQSIPYENPDDLQLNCPTDNSPYNPDAITSEYLTIYPEFGAETPSSMADLASSALSSPCDDIKDVNPPYDSIDMADISTTVSPYEKIRR